jgi:high-affinity iron transporter
MDPAPANFHDVQRMASRSVYGLYNTITLGVAGTPMAAFRQLSEDDRWALAFFAANAGTQAARREEGRALWKAGEARSVFTDLMNVVTLSRNEIVARHGEKAALVQDYLRSDPAVLSAARPQPLSYARSTLKAALEAYRAKDVALAQQLAVSAYLEGYELVEPALDAVDPELRLAIERDMLGLRTLMRDGAPVSEVETRIAQIGAGLERADEKLGGTALSPTAAGTSAFIIVLREGLEAILVLAALIAFLVKAERRDALRYVHAGWVAAIVLGIVTWFVASYAVAVSGASREMTEGVTALISTVILLYVGYWLHDKSHAKVWTAFIREKLAGALSGGTIWALAGLSFLAVYREIFETVLFFEALWVQGGEGAHGAIVIGFLAAAGVLALIAWLVFHYGVRLPIGLFFKVSSLFLALLAVAFAGQGVAALQAAGVIHATQISFPRIPVLGVFPTVQSLAAQVLVLAIIAAVFAWSRYAARPASPSDDTDPVL